MNQIETISALPRNQWICPGSIKETKKDRTKMDKDRSNLISLITTCITESFPELENCSETKFIRFQEKLKVIIQKNIDK